MKELKPCPFCGGEVIEYTDEYGGSWIEHKKKHKDGGLDDCILTSYQINTSSRAMIGEWNNRKEIKPIEDKGLLDLIRNIGAPQGLPLSLSQDLANAITSAGYIKKSDMVLEWKKIAHILIDTSHLKLDEQAKAIASSKDIIK